MLYNNGGVDFDEGGKLLLATMYIHIIILFYSKLKNKMHRPPSPSSITNSGFNSRNVSAYGFTLSNTSATMSSGNGGYMLQPSKQGINIYSSTSTSSLYKGNINSYPHYTKRSSYDGTHFRSNTNYVPMNLSFPGENRNEKDKAAVCLIDLSDRWFGKILYQYELKHIIFYIYYICYLYISLILIYNLI